MDYTLSDQYFTHTGTGQRMHKEDQAVPTAMTDKDFNAVNWSLMEIVKDAGLAGVQFDPNVPSTYRVLLNAVKAIYSASTSDLPGRVAIFWQPTPPPGWYWMEGDLLSRTANPTLWAHVQTVGAVSDAEWLAGAYGRFSSGDGSTTFRMPDIRGYFFRAADRSRGVDIGRLLWSVQTSLLGAHGHGVIDPTHSHAVLDPSHGHGVTDPSHGHGLNDPHHAHGKGATAGGGVNYVSDGPNPSYGATATDPAGTGISIQNNGTGVSVNGAITGVSVMAGATGISVQSSGGIETRPVNLAVPFYMKL